ncbi:DUF2069 domain-containing protein [Thiofilum flexile]|uniref:DUF2069 domain-containing protein n=1 Tax=Thiofilum flexile TaxID=125627 RepID=UPI0003820456|nr:DUF2069 domain-containing protein [Thiofilum flexile]
MITIPWYWKALSLAGLLGLIALILVWNLQLSLVQYVPLVLELSLLLIPLIVLVPGIVKDIGKIYVYAILLALVYVIIGFLNTGSEPLYGYSMIILSICLYSGSFMCAKVISRHNKAVALQQQGVIQK